MQKTPVFKKTKLATAISLATLPLFGAYGSGASAEENKAKLEEIVVTATRRNETVQDIPINISAVGEDAIKDLRLVGVSEIAHFVPGLTVIDRGPRDEVADLFVRGLNTSGLGPGFSSDTVAVYLGDIPLNVDLKPNDLERVEVLIGPQGTLYGQGTMGGAIRYIPKRADASEFTGQVRGNLSSTKESEDLANDVGLTLNIPLISDVLAFRATADYVNDPGFIDYPYVVRESGVSNPEPDFNDPEDVAANLRKVEDANGEETVSARVNLRFTPNDWLDASFWYYYQDTEAEGRQVSNTLTFGTGKYESAARYEEPNNYSNELLSIDVKADLGFAEASFIYGDSSYEELGQRDQTDLLLGFEYGYESFPTFSSFTRETVEEDSETVEARLVSQHEGPFQYVVGYFYNKVTSDAVSEEYTPGYDEFILGEDADPATLRPDSLEYIQLTDVNVEESAFYGELSYDIIPSVTVTAGFRQYEFKVNNIGGFGLPLADTIFGGEPNDAINVDLGENQGEDDGSLFKFNVSWDIDDDNMVYATYSEGYRNGGVNAVPECTEEQLNDPTNEQNLCAKADEVFIDPDTIDNYELGYKGILADGALAINAAVYYIDWQNLQVDTVTDFGNLPITGNGSAAESKGLELQTNWQISESFNANFTYAYTNAKLTEDAPGLVADYDALKGARLPGHAEHQGTLTLTYSTVVFDDMDLDIRYGIIYSGDFYNIVGGDEDPLVDSSCFEDDTPCSEPVPADYGGEAVPSWDLHSLSATFARDNWSVQGYVDNLWDEYYILGTRGTRRPSMLQDEQNGPGTVYGDFTLRSYGQYVGRPRTIGVKVSYDF